METLSYTQRIAGNFLRNMAPLPENPVVDEAYLQTCAPEGMRAGLVALYRLVMGIYWGITRCPTDFGLPEHPDVLPRAGSRYSAAVRAVEDVPRLLYAFGLYGLPLERDRQVGLHVDEARFRLFCGAAKIKHAERVLNGLAKTGLVIITENGPDPALEITFPDAPDIALALPAFSQAACAYGKDELRPPLEFYRADLRLLQPFQGKKKSIPVTLADAINPLDDEQAAILTEFDRLVESLGFRGEIKCSGLARGEWRGSYRSSRLGRTLFGFVVEEGQLGVRIMIDQTRPLLPYLQNCPADFRELFYASCICQGCGQCADGPLRIELDGKKRRICGYAYFAIPSFQSDHVAAMQMLLEAQAGLLKARQS